MRPASVVRIPPPRGLRPLRDDAALTEGRPEAQVRREPQRADHEHEPEHSVLGGTDTRRWPREVPPTAGPTAVPGSLGLMRFSSWDP